MSMKDIEGRSRTIFADLYCVRCSRSRYLNHHEGSGFPRHVGNGVLFPKRDALDRKLTFTLSYLSPCQRTLSVSQSSLRVSTSSFVTIRAESQQSPQHLEGRGADIVYRGLHQSTQLEAFQDGKSYLQLKYGSSGLDLNETSVWDCQ